MSTHPKSPPDASDALRSRLRAVVLLGGSVRPSELGRSVERSLLDLPVENDRSVLALWQSQVHALGRALGRPELPIRVLIDPGANEPTPGIGADLAPVAITRDRGEYRGTGGVLGDLASEYSPDDLLLVANASQVLIEEMSFMAADLARAGGDLALIAHADGTPVGMMLMAGRAMRSIPHIGFVDFKEQVLPRLSREHAVGVVSRPTATGIPIRLLDGYLGALRAHHLRLSGREPTGNPFEEDWLATFSIIEPGATIGPGARIHDGVVLRGGRVEAGAVVVRSIVVPGGFARRGKPVADLIVSDAGEDRGSR